MQQGARLSDDHERRPTRERGRTARSALLISLLALGLAVSGCQSVRSWTSGCPGVYSGIRYYNDQASFLPWDGKIFFTFDLPFSAVVDTLALPATAFADPQRPAGGFVRGCRWAAKGR